MSFEVQVAPLPPLWPGGERTSEYARKYSHFKVTGERTWNFMYREIGYLVRSSYDRNVILLEAGYKPSQIRMDGRPRLDARPEDPAVIVSFASKFGPLRYWCDTYRDYDSNVRAIALSLEALRAVDRHGVTRKGEQYAGFKALAASGESESVRAAAEWLASQSIESAISGREVWTAAQILAEPKGAGQSAYRIAARKFHPDSGGDRAAWARLQRVKETLGI